MKKGSLDHNNLSLLQELGLVRGFSFALPFNPTLEICTGFITNKDLSRPTGSVGYFSRCLA